MFVILIVAIGSIAWHYSRSRAVLEQWAAQNGYQIVNSEYRTFRRGPFLWSTSKGQTVYYVEVYDQQGNRRSGWVRCGSWWMGLWNDQAEVRWDE
jgi:hypothetical protein